jgi:small-conductance mechanosensitive channel
MDPTTIVTLAATDGELTNGVFQSLIPSFTSRVVVTVAAATVALLLLTQTKTLHDRNPSVFPKALWHAGVTITTLGVTLAAGTLILGVWGLYDQLVSIFSQYNVNTQTAVQAVLSVLFFVGAYATTSFLRELSDELARTRPSISDHQREIMYRLAQVSVYFVTLIVVLGLWNANLQGLLVGAGFLGIVVGMAARQTLGALIAGFVLMFSRPFEIGDWIEVGEYEGVVTDITVVNTRIQTFDGEYVMVPNDVVSSESLVNRSRKGRLRLEVEVGVDYDTDPERAADVANEAVSDLGETLNVPAPQVVLKEFADSSVLLGVRAWIDDPSARRRWKTRTAIVGAVKRAFDREGIKIPFPQRELLAREEAEGFVLADRSADEARRGDTSQTTATDGGSGGDRQ